MLLCLLISPPSSSSSSLMTSHGVALATAVAVSGTMILFALCRHNPFSIAAPTGTEALDQISTPPWCRLRSCMASSDERRRERAKRKKKRVQFAAEVEEFDFGSSNEAAPVEVEERPPERRMPANRAALYSGILRDRVMHRASCCY